MRLTYAEINTSITSTRLKGESYKVGFTVVATRDGSVIAAGQQHLTLNWETVLEQKEKDLKNEQRYSTAYYNLVIKIDHIGSKDEKKDLGEDGKTKWVSFKQHFFSNVLISKTVLIKATIAVSSSPNA